MKFVPRMQELLELEKIVFPEFKFSCRHRDILRCSSSKHFRSCYAPDGCFKDIPAKICGLDNVAIVFERDHSGDFLWRAFVKFEKFEWENVLRVGKIYGNPYNDYDIKTTISMRLGEASTYRVEFSNVDFFSAL